MTNEQRTGGKGRIKVPSWPSFPPPPHSTLYSEGRPLFVGAGNCSACSNSFGLRRQQARLREEGSQSLIRHRGGKKVKTRFVCRDFSTRWDARWGAAAAGRGEQGRGKWRG